MASNNPSQPELATEAREEGEVSSSSNDNQYPVCSAALSAAAVNPTASSRTILIPPMNKFTSANWAGKANFSTTSARSADPNIRSSQQPNNNKSFEKNRVPHISANPGKCASSGADDSLVIRFFSDDESGSESDDGEDKALKTKPNTTVINGNGRLPSVSAAKSSMSQQTKRNAKNIPKKSSMSRTFNSSMTKINGVANSRGVGSSSVGQGSQVKNFNSIKRNLASQEHGHEQGVDLNSTKVQDLRQQIALRERELKLKAAAQNKESASVSSKDYKSTNISSGAAWKSNAAFFEVGQLAPEEPDRKRLKVGGSYSKQLNSDGQQKMLVATSDLPSKENALESSSFQDKNMGDCSQKERPSKRTDSNVVKWERPDFRPVDISSAKLPASNVNHYSSRSDMSRMRVDPSVVLNETPPGSNANTSTLPKKRKSVDSNLAKNCGIQPRACLLKTSTSGQNLINSCEHLQGISGDKASCQASPNLNPWNCSGTVNVVEHNSIDMQLLVEMEESIDKELDEAQEHRHKCEIEERNALKAYRKAQRALIEANARCTELYRKRELHSAHLRSLIVNDSNLFLPSRRHEHVGTGLDCGNGVSRNVELIPSSSEQMQPEYDGFNQPRYDSVTGAPTNSLYRHANGHSLVSEPCSEPDASTSEPLPRNSLIAANGVSFQSNDSNISADEDEETFPLDHETDQPCFKLQQRDQNSVGRENHTDYHPHVDGPQDSLVLEAKLRSKLFARLPIRTFSKNGGSSAVEPAEEPGTEVDNRSERTQGSNGSMRLSETEKDRDYDLEGNDKPERTMSELPVQIQSHEKNSLNSHSAIDSEDNSTGGCQLTTSVISLPPLVLRSAFAQMKVMLPMTLIESQHTKSQQNDSCGGFNGEGGCMDSEDIQYDLLIANSKEESLGDICGTEIGTFTHNVAVDPFWPLCMYELRGKCNNDECPWQHVRDFSDQNAHQNQHDDSDGADCQAGLPLHQQKSDGGAKLSKCHGALIPPTYLVGLDILKSDSYKSVIARRNGQCWQKQFSLCLALSSLLKRDLLADQPSFCADDGRIEVHGSWNRQTSYFQSRKNIVNHLNQALPSSVQSLEMALLILSQEAYKLEGMKKSLSVLSRAIEADPTSEVLWMMYLLIYYSNMESVGNDDMFSYAVKNNDSSYGLWLIYINSRIHLDDRLIAYNAALSALCRHASAFDRDNKYASACILDLFLQMMDCLCMSGNVGKAIQKIQGLFPVAANSDEPHSLLLSDILMCLTISDKYIFWVCCVYLVIYRKLPDAIVQRFECEKELLAVEWPSVHLQNEEKQRAVKLVEMAVDSVNVCVDSESFESDTNVRLAKQFALSHIRCMLILDGLACCQNLLGMYMKLYPSCVELVLVSTRLITNGLGSVSFEGFEGAISNWPKEVPGIHCIWNQYIECALQNEGPNFAKELTVRWFNSVSKVRCPSNEILDAVDSNSSHGLLQLTSASNPDFLTSNSNQMDMMFGLINLSLAKLLHNDLTEAHVAIDRALKAAPPQYVKHCLREHAVFFLNYVPQLKKDAPVSEQLKILNGYLNDVQALPVYESLSGRFIDNIKKPKVQQLISNILSPVSSDFSLVNFVLEVWYGPSLLPPNSNELKELVDFVEAILEMVPSNYPLAFSVGKLLCGGYNSINVTSDSVLYWACSILVNTIFHAIPMPPEYVWVEAAGILGDISGIEFISDRFYKKALTAHPFSAKLWSCYYNLSKTREYEGTVAQKARERGIEVG